MPGRGSSEEPGDREAGHCLRFQSSRDGLGGAASSCPQRGEQRGNRSGVVCYKSRPTRDLRVIGGGQHLNDHWDLDHPFERLLVDTVVRPDPSAVSWINPRLRPGEERRVMTGIPGKTGIVYTLDRATGEFLWATPTVAQNVVSAIDGATGAVSENPELVFGSFGQEVLACPTAMGGKDWESVHRQPGISTTGVFVGRTATRTGPNEPKSACRYPKRLADRLAAAPLRAAGLIRTRVQAPSVLATPFHLV